MSPPDERTAHILIVAYGVLLALSWAVIGYCVHAAEELEEDGE